MHMKDYLECRFWVSLGPALLFVFALEIWVNVAAAFAFLCGFYYMSRHFLTNSTILSLIFIKLNSIPNYQIVKYLCEYS